MQTFSEHVGELLIALVVAVMGFFGKRELKRLDEKADKDDIVKALKQLESHMEEVKEERRDVSHRFDEFSHSLREVRENVARLVGRLER